MKRTLFYLFIVGLMISACSPQEGPSSVSRKITVTEQDIQDRLAHLSKEDADFASTPIGRQNLIQIILREKLIEADALAQAIDQSEDYQKLAQEKRALLDEIYQDYTRQLLADLWYEKQRKSGVLQVTDEEVDAYYKKYSYEMVVQQIIVDNAQTADQVLRTLKNSPSRWNEMSRKYNVAPQSIRDSKFTFMPGEFLSEIEVIAANSPVSQVQGFIKTAFGFHIIKKMQEKWLSKKEAEPRIRAVLENKKLDKAVETLQNKYEVVIYAQNE